MRSASFLYYFIFYVDFRIELHHYIRNIYSIFLEIQYILYLFMQRQDEQCQKYLSCVTIVTELLNRGFTKINDLPFMYAAENIFETFQPIIDGPLLHDLSFQRGELIQIQASPMFLHIYYICVSRMSQDNLFYDIYTKTPSALIILYELSVCTRMKLFCSEYFPF